MTEQMSSTRIGAGSIRMSERTASHITWDVVYCGPSGHCWMRAGHGQGRIPSPRVLEGDDVLGVISVRDIMRLATAGRDPRWAAVG